MQHYIINLPSSVKRKEEMKERLAHHKISVEFIDAIDKNSPIVDWFENGNKSTRISSRLEHCCFLSHIKAIRHFVDYSSDDAAVILEDDALFHKDYSTRLNEVIANRKGFNLIMLDHWVNSWENVKHTNIPGWYTITPLVYKTTAYVITREYATKCLAYLDRPLWAIQENRVVSELVTRLSKGAFVNSPLVIDLINESTIRVDEKNGEAKRKYYANHGIENYS